MDPWITLRHRDLTAERPAGATEDVHVPERLAERVVAEFSRVGDVVLDPFAGYGTTAVVAVRMGRRAVAVELLPDRAEITRARLRGEGRVIVGDARDLRSLVDEPVDLCFTSPPYMTRTGHPENPLTGYRTLDGDYAAYLGELEAVGAQVAALLRRGGHLVVNAATILGTSGPTPLADDLAERLSRHLVRRPDLPLAWDTPPVGIVADRCLVFEKAP
jgi:DNA modification methylase